MTQLSVPLTLFFALILICGQLKNFTMAKEVVTTLYELEKFIDDYDEGPKSVDYKEGDKIVEIQFNNYSYSRDQKTTLKLIFITMLSEILKKEIGHVFEIPYSHLPEYPHSPDLHEVTYVPVEPYVPDEPYVPHVTNVPVFPPGGTSGGAAGTGPVTAVTLKVITG